MSRDINPFGLRMPPDLRERLEASSEESGRSMNSELVHRLEASFTAQPAGNSTTAGVLGAMTTMLAKMLVRTAQVLTPEQKKRNPAVGVWEAVAEGVVDGRGSVIAEVISSLGSDFESSDHSAPKNKVLSSPGIIRQTLKDIESAKRLKGGDLQTVELLDKNVSVKRTRRQSKK